MIFVGVLVQYKQLVTGNQEQDEVLAYQSGCEMASNTVSAHEMRLYIY